LKKVKEIITDLGELILKKSELLSVVIPVYNVAPYLQRCLDSVCCQSYENLEIICVNDGSTDDSGEILDRYTQLDKRIKVIHTINCGQTRARKRGVEEASGKYVTFVDSDDYIEQVMYSELIELLKNEDADILVSQEIRDYEDYCIYKKSEYDAGVYVSEKLQKLKENIITTDKFFQFNISGHLWDKIFNLDFLRICLVNEPDKIRIGEDALVTYECILRAEKIIVSNKNYYHYCLRSDSVMGTIKDDDKERIEIFEKYSLDIFKRYENTVCNIMDQISVLNMYVKMFRRLEDILSYENEYFYPFGKINKDEKVLLYGAGKFGVELYHIIKKNCMIKDFDWADKNGNNGALPLEKIELKRYDKIIIAILLSEASDKVVDELLEKGVSRDLILLINF